MATQLVFVCRLTEKGYHCTFVFMSTIKYYNAIATLKTILCGCTGKRIFIGFIQTMHFVEKQHNLTLKALIIFSHLKI